jgi:hypothetical protein
MRFTFAATIALLSLLPLSASQAQTYDGLTPAAEEVCDGLMGREFGLCNAYCEAMDCDAQFDAPAACDSLRDNFYRATGSSAFPCDEYCPEIPDASCSGNGVLVTDASGCSACECDPDYSGVDCATCDVGFDACGVCGGEDILFCD